MDDEIPSIGAWLRAWRRSAGLSQTELAERSGLSLRTISNLERGRTHWPYPGSLNRLADALELSNSARADLLAAAGRRLAGGAAVATPVHSIDAPPRSVAVLRQLPAAVADFTGRARELAALSQLLEQSASAEGGGAVLISAIGGTAGIGKTALALHWVHQVAGRFPDGQLYLNLRGFGPAGTPMTPAEAIRRLLDGLEVLPERIPAELDAQSALFRSLLAGRRMIIVLDNASDPSQVRPLLPGAAGCVVLVTSRNQLAGLAAADGAHLLILDLLTEAEACELLTRRLGTQRAADESGALGELTRLCGRLPLALAIVAARACAWPDIPLAELAAELQDQSGRLDALDTGDPASSVRTVFSWSYRHLNADAARMFRLLGLHPGPDFDAYAAAALAGTACEHASRVLGQLTLAHLIQQPRPGCYDMHDLIRAYAGELAVAEDSAQQRHAALTRLLDQYLHTAAVAMDALHPAERDRRPSIPAPASAGPPLTGLVAARNWLDRQRAGLVAATVYAAVHGWPDHAGRLAAVLFRYLETGGHTQAAVTVHSHALKAAQHTKDRPAEAAALTHLGIVFWSQGQHHEAGRYLAQALAVFQESGDQLGEARALGNLGLVDLEQGRYPQAARRLKGALALYRKTGDQLGEARALGDLGRVDMQQGRRDQAVRQYRQALALFQAAGDTGGEARTLGNLGHADLEQGRYESAIAYQEQALTLCRKTGYRIGEAHALHNLGCICLRQGQYESAINHLSHALTLHRETRSRSSEAEALTDLGDAFLGAGRTGDARIHYAAAFSLISQNGDERLQAQALVNGS